jgi:hypothetical protein
MLTELMWLKIEICFGLLQKQLATFMCHKSKKFLDKLNKYQFDGANYLHIVVIIAGPRKL